MAVLTDMISTGKELVRERVSEMQRKRREVLGEFLDPLKGKPVVSFLVRPFAEFIAGYEALCFPHPPIYRNTVYADVTAMTGNVTPLDRYR